MSHGVRCLVPLMLLTATAAAQGPLLRKPTEFEAYRRVVAKTADMVRDGSIKYELKRLGLSILNLTWEDTGRFKNSAVGPNISDMTIQVQQMDPRTEKFSLTCMPVIRFPNFADVTADLPMESFWLLVGNEKGKEPRRITLRDYLGDLRRYLSKPGSWAGKRRSVLAPRDRHVLVSAQACFLPVTRGGKAEFNPVLFNYQSRRGDPAVLAILCTREGTSATVIDNHRDAFQAGRTWGQRLFFNQNGERASLTGQRLSDFDGPRTDDEKSPEVGRAAGLNLVLLIQVPLKQKQRMWRAGEGGVPSPPASGGLRERKSNVEDAVIGHGRVEGPFTEIDGLEIERDVRFPIRVTVQFYLATDDGVASRRDMSSIAAQIRRVYSEAAFVGSLVTQGETGRPTEHDGPKLEPPGWWETFWQHHYRDTGYDPQQVMRMLRLLLGPDWKSVSEGDAVKALVEAGYPTRSS